MTYDRSRYSNTTVWCLMAVAFVIVAGCVYVLANIALWFLEHS